MNGRFATLVKREFWEHRALWIAPVVVAGILLLVTIVGVSFASVHMNPQPFRMPTGVPVTAMHMGVLSMTSQIGMVAAIVCGFYMLDCLYAERKDRSILFWKSLPVSDTATVLAKAFVGMVLVPLGAYVLALVVYPLIYGIAAVGLPNFMTRTGGWDTWLWIRAEANTLAAMLVTLLWYAPLSVWAMLASVLSRRSPFLIAVLPFPVLAVCENILLQTAHVWRFIGHRLVPIIDPASGLQRPGLWIGLAVTAGMLYMVIRLRRYRDDT